jgi:RNase P subunit RPR2
MTTRERIDCEREQRDAIAWDQFKADMRYWDDARPGETVWSCEACGHPRYSEHHSILGGEEQHWVTCDHCGTPAEFPAEKMRKPMQFEFSMLRESLTKSEEEWTEAA